MKDNTISRLYEEQGVVKEYVPSLDAVMKDPSVLQKFAEGPQETEGPAGKVEPAPPAGTQGSSGPPQGGAETDTVLGADAGTAGQAPAGQEQKPPQTATQQPKKEETASQPPPPPQTGA